MIGGLLVQAARITTTFSIFGGMAGAGVAGPAGAVAGGVGGAACAVGFMALATVVAGGIALSSTLSS